MTAILFDAETTGLTEPQIIEWCYQFVTLPFDIEASRLGASGRCKPSKPIEFGALATHGILDHELARFPDAADFKLPSEVEFVIGWNVASDLSAIPNSDGLKPIDLIGIARRFWPDSDSYSQSAIIYRLFGRTDVAREMVNEAHSAVMDVLNLAAIFGKAADHRPGLFADFNTLYEFSEECSVPEIMPMGKFKGRPVSEVDQGWRKWYFNMPDADPNILKALDKWPFGCRMPDPNRYAARQS